MNILKLDYQGLPVHANREAWFNATQIAAMFGRRPIDWLRLPETERYIRALCKPQHPYRHGCPICHITKTGFSRRNR